MWRKYDKFDVTTNFVAWACTIIKYETLNFRRSMNRCPVHFDSETYEEASLFQKTEIKECNEKHEKLQKALNSLDETSRRLLISVYVNKEEAKELAKKDGKSPQTYYNKLNLAKRKLESILK
jgi:RNA polymerase sigma-70 factor (ECF subfamily)